MSQRQCLKEGCTNQLDADQAVCDVCGTPNPVPQTPPAPAQAEPMTTSGPAPIVVAAPTPAGRRDARPRDSRRTTPRGATQAAPAAAPTPLAALAAETSPPPPKAVATPADGTPVPPTRSGTTLTGVGSAPQPPAAPKIVDVRFQGSSQPLEAILLSKPGDVACTVMVPLRHLAVSASPVASFSTTVDGKNLTGCFTPSHELRVDSDTGAPSIVVGATNLTFDEGFRLPSGSRELLVRFPDGVEVRATWVERDPVLKLAFPLGSWHTTQRAEVQIRGRDAVDSRISQFQLRTVEGTPEMLIVFRPLSAFCHKCRNELRDGVCPQCPQQPAEPVVTAPAPAVFNPFAVAAQVPAPAPVATASAPATVSTAKAPVAAAPPPVVVPAADLPYAPPGAAAQTATASPPASPAAAPTEAVVICKYMGCNTPRRLLTDKSCRKCGTLYPCAGCDAPRKLPTDKACRQCGKPFPS